MKLKPTSSLGSFYKVSGQEGASYCPDKTCVEGQTSAIYIPYKSGFNAPEVNRYFKYEWESNNTMSSVADDTNLGKWNVGTIKDTLDKDYWDFDISTGKYYKFIMKVPKIDGIDYDFIIYNDSGTEIAKLHNGQKIDEKNDVWLNSGHYYVKIYPYSGSSEYDQYQWIYN